MANQTHDLYWDSTFAIAMALMEQYPRRNLEDIGLQELAELVVNLPGFRDEPSQYTDQILLDIQTVWYEEATNL